MSPGSSAEIPDRVGRNGQVWLVTTGEPLPLGSETRLLRAGLLANTLVERGYRVLWWTSTFDHGSKSQLFDQDTTIDVSEALQLRLIRLPSYRRNISVSRVMNHALLALRWKRQAKRVPPPGIIVCSMPPIEICATVAGYGAARGVPVVVDVRDLWPDAMVSSAPRLLRPLVGLATTPLGRLAHRSLMRATAITAISPGYMAWAVRRAGRRPGALDAVFPLGYSPGSVTEDASRRAESELRALGVDPAAQVCWFSGFFGATYDLETVIEGARQMFMQGSRNVQFVFSGRGEREEALRRRASDLPNVIFVGWQGPAGLQWLARVADVGLAPYAPDAPQGWPNKLFEYFHAGLPVLSSLRGEAADLLTTHRCGLTYAARDPAAFVDRLMEVLRDSALRFELASNSRRVFDQEFAANTVYERMADHIAELAFYKGP